MSMDLQQLLGVEDAPRLRVDGLCSDSRRVRPGDVFFAYRGRAFDGHDFAADAIKAGAVAVVSERPVDGAPNVVVEDVAGRLGEWSARFHGAPSKALQVVGVTGTNGKTTVAYCMAQVAGGAYVGTLGWGVPPALRPSTLTTADPVTLHAWLRTLKDGGQQFVALEASSHALVQGRVDAVDFAAGVFTNLSRDHLEYHRTMVRYAAAKRRLFARDLSIAVVNVDDPQGAVIAEALPPGCDLVSIGRNGTVRWKSAASDANGIRGTWITPWGDAEFHLPAFFGTFSIYNAATVLATCCALGVASLAEAVRAMARLPGVPGRMQRVADAPLVLVDYAHTPDGLRAVLAAARAHARKRIILVFGCGGDRDRGKRSAMAQAAEGGADIVIATSDNPRSENPQRILNDVMTGLRDPKAALRIDDRREAIAAALDLAASDDVVIVAGKGHEDVQIIGDERIPFDDAAVVRELLGGEEQAPRAPQGENA